MDEEQAETIVLLTAYCERLEKEIAAYKRAMPGWVYSPLGDGLYHTDAGEGWELL